MKLRNQNVTGISSDSLSISPPIPFRLAGMEKTLIVCCLQTQVTWLLYIFLVRVLPVIC